MNSLVRKIVFAVMAVTFTGAISGFDSAWAGGSAWETYAKAAKLHEQGGSQQEIRELCQAARKMSEDPVLFARASLLLSQLEIDQSDLRAAHKVLRELYFTERYMPAAVQDDARLRAARLLLRQKDREQALALIEPVARNGANSFFRHEGRIVLAQLYADEANWQKSDSLIHQIISQRPAYGSKDERVLVVQARRAMAQNNIVFAIDLLQDCTSQIALSYLAQAYDMAGKPIMAVGVYKKIHDRFPNSSQARRALFLAGEVFMRSKDWMAARNQFNQLLQEFPQTEYRVAVEFRLGWIYLQLDEIDQALTAFRSSSSGKARNYFSYMEAEALRQQGPLQPGKYQQAIMKYSSIAAIEPDSRLGRMSKLRAAMTLLEQGKTTDAVISLRQFLALYPKDDLAPMVTFLLATNSPADTRDIYFNEILQKNWDGAVFDPALAFLQKQDYSRGNYQEVINRNARLALPELGVNQTYWRRVQKLIAAEAAYYLKQYAKARSDYASVAGELDDDLSPKAALGQAWCMLQSGNPDSAAAAFQEMRTRYSGEHHVRASFGLATAYFRMRQFEKAIQTYPTNLPDEAATGLSGLAARSQFHLAESYFRLEYYEQAIEAWQRLAQDFPESELAPVAQYQIGDTYFRANHFDEAKSAFLSLRNNYGSHSLAAVGMLRLGQCEFNAGRYNEAIPVFRKYIELYPEAETATDALEGIQLCYYQLGQAEQASEAFEKLIRQSPDGMLAADARFRLAQNYLELDRQPKAITAFKEILTLYPGTSYAKDAQLALARAYASKEDFPAANEEFLRYLKYFPDSQEIPAVLFELGAGYFNLESYLSASDYFNRIVQDFAGTSFYRPALQNLGWCFDRLGEKERALSYLDAYLGENSGAVDAKRVKLQVARIKAELGLRDPALYILRDLQSADDSEIATEASYRLGSIYREMQRWQPARQAFNDAIRKGAQDDYYRLSAISELAAIYETEQDWPRAVAAYQLLAESAPEEMWVSAAQERINALTPMLSH